MRAKNILCYLINGNDFEICQVNVPGKVVSIEHSSIPANPPTTVLSSLGVDCFNVIAVP